jgi:hypothetical protein
MLPWSELSGGGVVCPASSFAQIPVGSLPFATNGSMRVDLSLGEPK